MIITPYINFVVFLFNKKAKLQTIIPASKFLCNVYRAVIRKFAYYSGCGVYFFYLMTASFLWYPVCAFTYFPFILTLISRISYTRFIFFPFARNLILQSRIYLCKVDFTFSIHQFHASTRIV